MKLKGSQKHEEVWNTAMGTCSLVQWSKVTPPIPNTWTDILGFQCEALYLEWPGDFWGCWWWKRNPEPLSA